jgi:hypothetical protein
LKTNIIIVYIFAVITIRIISFKTKLFHIDVIVFGDWLKRTNSDI